MKLRKCKTDRSVSLDETFDTREETVTREIAVWAADPEQLYSHYVFVPRHAAVDGVAEQMGQWKLCILPAQRVAQVLDDEIRPNPIVHPARAPE